MAVGGSLACRVCGAPLADRRRRYCEDHAEGADAEARRAAYARWYARHGKGADLGTGNLGPHREADFSREEAEVRAELRRLGLR